MGDEGLVWRLQVLDVCRYDVEVDNSTQAGSDDGGNTNGRVGI